MAGYSAGTPGSPVQPGGNGASGPGQTSRRTDLGPAQKIQSLPNAQYGEAKQFQQLQQGAPLAQSGNMPTGAPAGPAPNPHANAVVPLSAPTQRPNEPVTSGAAKGPGPGPEALGLSPAQSEQADMTRAARDMPLLQMVANLPNSSPSSRLFVNLVNANS
jgi:hypothetical protein